MEARTGRPHKFGEPTVRREFRFPESLNARLTKYSRDNGEDVSDIVRTAVEKELDSSKGQSNASTTSNEISEELLAEIRQSVLAAFNEGRAKDSLSVNLRDPDRERLETVAQAIGYTNPADLVEDVMRTLLRRPEEITEMLLGSSVRALQQALENEGNFEAAAAGRAELRKLNERVSRKPTPKTARKNAA